MAAVKWHPPSKDWFRIKLAFTMLCYVMLRLLLETRRWQTLRRKGSVSRRNKNRKRACIFLVSIPGSRWKYSNNCGASTLQNKIKQPMEEAKKVERESGRNRVKTRVNGRASTRWGWRALVSDSVQMCFTFPRGFEVGSKPVFFLLDQRVTKPAYLLIQPGVYSPVS